MSCERIQDLLSRSAELKASASRNVDFLNQVNQAALFMKETVARRGTITLCGNGGSACDAVHFCEELVARYKRERPGIRARQLLDPAVITCWANDYSFESVFARQVETLCTADDLLVVFSTSGNSRNILTALRAAKGTKTRSIGVLGRDGGEAAGLADLAVIVPAEETERIQEIHITLVHIWCELLES